MGNNESERVMKGFEELRASMDVKTANKLNLDLLERIIKRVESYSIECEECSRNLGELEEHINKLKANQGIFDKNDFKHNNTVISGITAHLQKQHKLITEGTYLAIYMCLGMSIGLVFGMTVFDNMALGMPVGMCLGLAIGASMDADAKKKGKTI